MSDRTREIPDAWGDGKLSGYVGTVHGNTMFLFEEDKRHALDPAFAS
jgi:hypothetical protein